jgi:hypothetical protein
MRPTKLLACAALLRHLCSFLPVLIFIGSMAGCTGGNSTSSQASSQTSPTTFSLRSITLGPSSASIISGGSQQYTAIGNYTDGSAKDVTRTLTWSSSDATVATVTATGLATTLKEGTVTITASLQSVAGSTTLTATPLVVQVSVSISDSTGHALQYRWQSSDGIIQNVNAPTTMWTLPDGPGLHFAYVLVSNGVGGYIERRIAVNTDTIGTPLHVASPIPFAPPTPAFLGNPTADSHVPIFRGFLTGGQLSTVGSFPGVGPNWNPGIPVSVPDVPLFGDDSVTGQQYPATGASGCSNLSKTSPCTIASNVRGEFVFPSMSTSTIDFNGFILNCFGFPVLCGQWSPPTVPTSLSISAYAPPFGPYVVNKSPDVAGEVLLQDGSPCGTVNEFFGIEVVASATLLDGSGNVLAGPVRANEWGDYDLPYKNGAVSVSLKCENAPSITVPISNPNTMATTQLPPQTFPVTPPKVTAMTAFLNSQGVGQFLPPATGVPSDIVPLADAFLAEKGLDSRLGACQYYKSVGAVKACDAAGNFTGAITFEDWKSQVHIDQYALPPSSSSKISPGGPLYTATFINKEDLNIARNHHSIYNGYPANINTLSQAPYTFIATYVCNHQGPTGPNALNPTQGTVDSVIQDMVNGLNLIACVAMDYSTFPVPNPSGGGNELYGPFIRFLIFGPSGQLLPSINLDTRTEKFVPGTCVVCHGGDYYAGKYPEDGSGSPDVGGHFIPYDEGNFEFSSQRGLTQADQEEAVYNLNQNIIGPTEDLNGILTSPGGIGASATNAARTLIDGWYLTSHVQNQNYVDPSWIGQILNGFKAEPVYQNVYARSCRSCHIAIQTGIPGAAAAASIFPASPYNFEFFKNFNLVAALVVDPGNCPGPNGNLGLDRNRMYKMPNSLVTFNQFWLSLGSNLTVPTTPEPNQPTLLHQFFNCKFSTQP